MQPTEIVLEDAARRGVDGDQVIRVMEDVIQKGYGSIMQFGDTLLFICTFSPKAAELHLFTVDHPKKIIKAIKNFHELLKETNLKQVYGRADSPQLIRMLEAAGVHVMKPENPIFNWMADI